MEKSISDNSAALNSSNDRNDGLTPSQERAVTAMLTARSPAPPLKKGEQKAYNFSKTRSNPLTQNQPLTS